MAAMIDLGALRQSLVDWPESMRGISSARLKLALSRALATARFIRFIDGRND
jgi:predicted YcjX-like family ATPase